MSIQVANILTLAEQWAAHDGVSHWTISTRVARKGDLLSRLMKGGDLHTARAESVTREFSAQWPADLEWPADIPRPTIQEDAP